MNEKLKLKIQRKQKTIVSDDAPLYRYGYWRQGYTKGGKERWVLREFQYAQNNKCYGKNNPVRGKLINETWEEYHIYLQKLMPRYKKTSEADKERMENFTRYRNNA